MKTNHRPVKHLSASRPRAVIQCVLQAEGLWSPLYGCLKGSLDVDETSIGWQDSAIFLVGDRQQKSSSQRLLYGLSVPLQWLKALEVRVYTLCSVHESVKIL